MRNKWLWVNTINTTKEKIKQAKEEAVQKAKVVGEEVASGLSKAAIFSFFGLLLGAISASIGAGLAVRRRERYLTETTAREV